jgi:hypothetical protein
MTEHDAILRAPCVFCAYRGAGYYQTGTHNAGCPWREIGGRSERDAAIRDIIGRGFADLHSLLAERERELAEAMEQNNAWRSAIESQACGAIVSPDAARTAVKELLASRDEALAEVARLNEELNDRATELVNLRDRMSSLEKLDVLQMRDERDLALAEVARLRNELDGSQLRTEKQRQRRDEDRAHLLALVQTLEPLVVSRAASRPLREALASACAHLGLGPDGEAKALPAELEHPANAMAREAMFAQVESTAGVGGTVTTYEYTEAAARGLGAGEAKEET